MMPPSSPPAGSVAPSPPSPHVGIAAAPSSSPFGWTGIRRERYTRWRGHLDGRRKIVMRMMTEGVRLNIKTWPVIILLVLGWMFTAFFPVLFSAMGGLPLEADNIDTWTGAESTQAGMHGLITNTSTGIYPLKGAAFTNRTSFDTLNVPPGWGAYVSAFVSNGTWNAILFVNPNPNALPLDSATVQVQATTGGRVDSFTALTTIVPDHHSLSMDHSYELDFAAGSFEGRAGGTAGVRFNVTNTGLLPDGYNITVNPASGGWGLSVYVNGTKVALKTRTTGGEGQGPEIPAMTVQKYFQLDLSPGASARCEARFSTRTDSPRQNDVNIIVGSRADAAVSGSYHVAMKLSGTKKVDLTGSILFDQVMSNQVLFALLLAAVVGSRMIATDLHEKSYNLYFARPLTKKDYIIGKFGTVSALLSLATIVPALVTYALITLLSNISGTYFIDHLWAWGAILGDGIAVVLTLSTLSLAFSSMTSRRFYAAAAVVVVYLVTSILGSIVMSAFNNGYGRLVGIPDDLEVVGRTAFGVAGTLNLAFPWYYSLGVLAAIWAFCLFLVWFRVEKTELSE